MNRQLCPTARAAPGSLNQGAGSLLSVGDVSPVSILRTNMLCRFSKQHRCLYQRIYASLKQLLAVHTSVKITKSRPKRATLCKQQPKHLKKVDEWMFTDLKIEKASTILSIRANIYDLCIDVYYPACFNETRIPHSGVGGWGRRAARSSRVPRSPRVPRRPRVPRSRRPARAGPAAPRVPL